MSEKEDIDLFEVEKGAIISAMDGIILNTQLSIIGLEVRLQTKIDSTKLMIPIDKTRFLTLEIK